MAQYVNLQELENMVSDYYTSPDFELYSSSSDDTPPDEDDYLDSHIQQHHSDLSKPKTDTSATEARHGKDIQGIPWERLNFTRDNYRQTRLSQYRNYETLPFPRGRVLEKDCKEVDKGQSFYDFHFNTRLVKSTIVHFQIITLATHEFS